MRVGFAFVLMFAQPVTPLAFAVTAIDVRFQVATNTSFDPSAFTHWNESRRQDKCLKMPTSLADIFVKSLLDYEFLKKGLGGACDNENQMLPFDNQFKQHTMTWLIDCVIKLVNTSDPYCLDPNKLKIME